MTQTFDTPVLSSEVRDGKQWVAVEAQHWHAIHVELSSSFPRFEWLTAVHNLNEDFDVTSMVSTVDLTSAALVTARVVDGSIDTVASVYAVADFYEREAIQMFGLRIGDVERSSAFDTQFDGYPLRRDFALTPRETTEWPGAVEPDVNARRRPALPPGVFAEWQS